MEGNDLSACMRSRLPDAIGSFLPLDFPSTPTPPAAFPRRLLIIATEEYRTLCRPCVRHILHRPAALITVTAAAAVTTARQRPTPSEFRCITEFHQPRCPLRLLQVEAQVSPRPSYTVARGWRAAGQKSKKQGSTADMPTAKRKSHALDLQSVNDSLTPAHPIPASHESPPLTPTNNGFAHTSGDKSRPPTAGGGPLSSHPTDHPMPMPGAFPPTPEPEKEENTSANATMSSESNRYTDGSSQSPTSPQSANNMAPPAGTRRPSSVRRLFSLTSLRQSFSSSRTSFSIPPSSSAGPSTEYQRAQSPGPSMMSVPASTMHSSKPSNSLRQKRSSSWFKRKSGFFQANEDGMLEVVGEDSRLDTRSNKRFKESTPLPMLPEISTLSGGDLQHGSLGWDEQLFKR